VMLAAPKWLRVSVGFVSQPLIFYNSCSKTQIQKIEDQHHSCDRIWE
jgi:hypothetical protein